MIRVRLGGVRVVEDWGGNEMLLDELTVGDGRSFEKLREVWREYSGTLRKNSGT